MKDSEEEKVSQKTEDTKNEEFPYVPIIIFLLKE